MKILRAPMLCILLTLLGFMASSAYACGHCPHTGGYSSNNNPYPYFDGTYYDDSYPEDPFIPDTVPYDGSKDYFGKIYVSPNAPGTYNMDYWQDMRTPQGYPDKGPPYPSGIDTDY